MKGRCSASAVVLSSEDGGGFASGLLANDLLDVLVTTLRGFPVRVSKGSRFEGNVERV